MSIARTVLRLPFAVAALTMLAFAAVASAAPSAADEKAKRVAFNQIKDRTFTGVRGDGAEVVETYCANGKYESRVSDDTYGTGVSKGKNWRVAEATVTKGGKSITAFIKGAGGYETALVLRGTQWKVGVASLGRVLYPGNVTRTDGKAACAAM